MMNANSHFGTLRYSLIVYTILCMQIKLLQTKISLYVSQLLLNLGIIGK